MIFFLELSDALSLHDEQVRLYGGSFGVRSESLLQSALEMPQQGFSDDYFHEFPFGMAAAYLFHIAKNHPFVDGNKRTALYCAEVFLGMNGYELVCGGEELEEVVIGVATGEMGKEELGRFFEDNCREKKEGEK